MNKPPFESRPAPRAIVLENISESSPFWQMEHRRAVEYSNWLCETFKFSRKGYVKGKVVSVKELRKIVDKVG
jgi:hypothetical protein